MDLVSMTLRFYNTMSREVEDFSPMTPRKVTMYHCGPTVYNFAHIGNMRAFVFADLLRRTLEWNGYETLQIMNITDVGHLVSDGDEGEDKMEKGAQREGKSAREIADMYESAFHEDLKALNVKVAHYYPRATDHIAEQIALIQNLELKSMTYMTSDGVYFDTTKYPDYGKMARLDLAGQREGARVDVNTEKRNSSDFALWKFSPKDGVKREQEWESPWGVGFPGWHIECSAMAIKYLGETIDIHTGGVDHIPVHHTNEIAQSECATGKQFAHFWMHSAFMNVDGQKMSKSLGNTYTLKDLVVNGVRPTAFRYWLLNARYRTQVNVTWEALKSADKSIEELYRKFLLMKMHWGADNHENATFDSSIQAQFTDAINDDLNTAKGLALLHSLFHEPTDAEKDARDIATILKIDEVLGLGFSSLHALPPPPISSEAAILLDKRREARASKDWAGSDRLRDELALLGYVVTDTPEGQVLTKK